MISRVCKEKRMPFEVSIKELRSIELLHVLKWKKVITRPILEREKGDCTIEIIRYYFLSGAIEESSVACVVLETNPMIAVNISISKSSYSFL